MDPSISDHCQWHKIKPSFMHLTDCRLQHLKHALRSCSDQHTPLPPGIYERLAEETTSQATCTAIISSVRHWARDIGRGYHLAFFNPKHLDSSICDPPVVEGIYL